MRKKNTRIKIPLRSSIPMITGYVKTLIVEQIQAVSFILVYLIVFQRLILGILMSPAAPAPVSEEIRNFAGRPSGV